MIVKFLILKESGAHTPAFPYIIIAEITLPSFVIFHAHRFSRALRDFERAVEDITMEGMNRRFQTVDEASDVLQKELKLSRRKHRPLSVILLECEPESTEATLNRALEEVQRSIVRRHSLLSLSKALDRLLRSSDMVFSWHSAYLVCPETRDKLNIPVGPRRRSGRKAWIERVLFYRISSR